MKRFLFSIIIALVWLAANAQEQKDPIYRSTPSYFNSVVAATDEYITLMYNLQKTPSVRDLADAAYKEDATVGRKFKALYARDLCRAMDEMGYDVEFLNNPESLPLIVLFFHDNNGQPNKQRLAFDLLPRTKTFLKNEQEWLTGLRNKMNKLNPDKSLCVAKLLTEAGRPDLCKQYYDALLKFSTLIANADNAQSAKEKAWLAQLKKQSTAVAAVKPKTAGTAADGGTLGSGRPDDPFVRLDELIGLDEVKEKVRTLANTVKIQKMKEQRGLKTQPMSYHCVFLGNPGTGKTTVARILADIYRELGVVKKGHLVETDRSGLIASYVGQTAPKVNHVCDSALNGILFIDEAYAITQGAGNDYGNEAVATLLKRMEDDRDKLVVILAGYSREMNDFLEANSGIKSRINNYINFPDYTASELFKIYQQNVKRNDCILEKNAEQTVKDYINKSVANKDAYFGNARFVRNFVEKTLEEQANRLSTYTGNITNDMLRSIQKSDVENAVKAMKNNK